MSDVPAPFRVELCSKRQRILVVPVGELDLSTVEAFQTQLEDALAADWRTVSTGPQSASSSHERFQEQGVDFAIIEDPGPVRRLLEIAGVLHIFKRVAAPLKRLWRRPMTREGRGRTC